MAHITVSDEQYVFTPGAKKKTYYLLALGVFLFVLGIVLSMTGGDHEVHQESIHGGQHSTEADYDAPGVSVKDYGDANDGATPEEKGESHEVSAEAHHVEGPAWVKRLYTTLWMNNIYFVGLGIIGLFFVAIQYAAQAGWSAGIIRIPLAMGSWIPLAGILTLILWFVVKGDIFHWVHGELYTADSTEYDPIINKKAPFFFWPLEGGTFPIFFIARMVIFFGLWYYFFLQIRKNMLAEDIDPSVSYWYKNRTLSAWFLIFFGISSSVAAWDWVMSIDTHWFSTMFGWYVFASWWVTGLAFITLIVAHLKDAGYLKIVNSNHLHDLGKFIFAFSIFWTYIWFGQFLLIYYANIPEESVYFVERMATNPYSWIFYANLILNFVLPFLLLMTRDAKRQVSMLKLICPIILIGHWFDFYNMVTPGVMHYQGSLGFMEIGLALIFMAVFLLVTLSTLARVPLIGRNHPMLEESLHHHI